MMVPPPPPPAVGVVEVSGVLPPQAESTRARDAAPAAAVTQRALTVLPRIDPPRDSKGLRHHHRHKRPPQRPARSDCYRIASPSRPGGVIGAQRCDLEHNVSKRGVSEARPQGAETRS